VSPAELEKREGRGKLMERPVVGRSKERYGKKLTSEAPGIRPRGTRARRPTSTAGTSQDGEIQGARRVRKDAPEKSRG